MSEEGRHPRERESPPRAEVDASVPLPAEPAPDDVHARRLADMEREIGRKEARKLKARQEKYRSVWFGLGMFGMIGWSVAVPTLIGIAIGCWIDHHWPSRYSWTLMLLLAGVALGCANAWHWIQKESRPPD